jgi:hypothetical protein
MKKIAALCVLAAMAASATGCAYGSIATAGNDKVVITRQDGFLFGALRKVFVCKVTDGGTASCGTNESP